MNNAIPDNIRLDPVDWFLAEWRDLPPLPLPPVSPFDRDACLGRLGKIKLLSNWWNWEPAGIAPVMSPEEGRFWLWAMIHASEVLGARDLVKLVRGQKTDEPPTLEQIQAGFRKRNTGVGPELAPVVWSAFSPEEFVRLYFELWPAQEQQRRLVGPLAEERARAVCAGFLKYLRPYLHREELSPFRAIVGPLFLGRLVARSYVPYPLAYLARALGMSEEVKLLVSSWADGSYSTSYGHGGSDATFITFGLGDARSVRDELSRLGARLRTEEQVRAFLAHTGTSALDVVRDHILAATNRETAEELTEAFGRVETVAMAPLMLELTLSSKGGMSARRWLDLHRELAVAGLLSLVAERGKLGEAALAYLRDTAMAGQAEVIQRALAAQEGVVAERILKALEAVSTAAAEAFDDASLPEWFSRARPANKVKMPIWVDTATLPPITLQGRPLAPEQMKSVLGDLRDSTLAAPGELVVELKKNADRASLETFIWDLFERWLAVGAPPKDKWTMTALGLLGGDATCLKLWPLVRDWPGQGQHKRAVYGAECLRAIGTEQALLQLRKLADKVRFPALKKKAQTFMQEIADERGLTAAQLEDRIVPDLGLDEQGTRVMDYGTRQFRVALGPDLKPRVREETGAIRTDLPRPTAKDDATKAEATQADWKLFKQQLKEVLKTQSERLDKAMTRRRRWSVSEFQQYLIRHPLMRYLAQVVLWGGFDGQGKLAGAFRVTEDCTFADVNGEPVSLDPTWLIGVVHPLHLAEGDVAKWTEVFADHEILQPFTQLGKRVFKLEPAEVGEKILKRFVGLKVPGMALLGAAKKLGWAAGPCDTNYRVTRHRKHYPEAGTTAFFCYQPGLEVHGYGSAADEQELGDCYFVPGSDDHVKVATAEMAMPLGTVDALVLNEVASLLLALSGKKE
jgi:hypothetical protein